MEGALSTILKDQVPPAALVRQRLIQPVFGDEPEMESPSPSAGKDFEPLEGEASVLGISLKKSNHLVLEDTPVVIESSVEQSEHPSRVLEGDTPNEPVSSLCSRCLRSTSCKYPPFKDVRGAWRSVNRRAL